MKPIVDIITQKSQIFQKPIRKNSIKGFNGIHDRKININENCFKSAP